MDNIINKRLVVPKGIRYISEWKGFSLENFRYILDKKIPGCGFTEFCITNSEDIILCSPRRILLENKRDQHIDDVLYVCNTYDDDKLTVDKDLSRNKRSFLGEGNDEDSEERCNYYKEVKKSIEDYIRSRRFTLRPCKILVTYDSFRLVKEVLEEKSYISSFRVIVDEFQSIFIDSKFKSGTEIDFLNQLENLQKVCFVSATPMMEEYLRKISIFSNLPYYELDWEDEDPGRVCKPRLIVKTTKSVFETANKVIEKYKSGNFEKKYVKDITSGKIDVVESKEAVIYVNSVNNIISIVKKSGLLPEEVNILCAKTPENESRLLRKLGKRFKIGSIPLKGEPHKMFTFCTRTVYLGADFYSTCARTFVISDANIETLAVDISLDLPQILGRQRLVENPWKNEAEFYYKALSQKKILTKEEFNERILEKELKTSRLLSAYNTATEDDRKALIEVYDMHAKAYNYKVDYVAVNFIKTGRRIRLGTEIIDETVPIPVENILVKISEQRAFDIQQIDYADRFSVFSSINRFTRELGEDGKRAMQFLKEYEILPTLVDKLKFLCDLSDGGQLSPEILDNLTEKHFYEYFTILGAPRVRASGYNPTLLNRELGFISFDKTRLADKIYSEFIIGNRYTLVYIREVLRRVYDDLGYPKIPVATDLEQYFEVKVIQVNKSLGNGKYKRERGFEILSKK